MTQFYLFESGSTHIVVTVLRVQDGTAHCRIYRTLEEYWTVSGSIARQARRRLQHGSLHQGDELEIPWAWLRPCPIDVRLGRPRPRQCIMWLRMKEYIRRGLLYGHTHRKKEQ